jgi:NTP pyrophosphatase (non-canonical NTP hydrolase)
MSFIAEMTRVQKAMQRNAVRKGFHEIDDQIAALHNQYGVPVDLVMSIQEARIAQRLMLVVSELSEGLEALRNGNPPDSHIPKFSGLSAELADAVIRILNLAEHEGINLGKAVVAKAAYNTTRPHRHGGKKF